jgi:acetyltransferase-like isoleucine patch superfamily enzyme
MHQELAQLQLKGDSGIKIEIDCSGGRSGVEESILFSEIWDKISMSTEISKDKIIREKLKQARSNPLKTYMELTVGDTGRTGFIKYEIITSLFGATPGGLGFFLRKKFYPHLFEKVGRGLIIGRNVVIRHPDKITIGDNVTIDDNCLIDARGAGSEGLVLEDGVIINRNCMVQAKNGPIRLGRRTSLGSNSVVVSLGGIDIGEAVLTAAGCYISAGAYEFDNLATPVMDQRVYTKGPIRIGSKAWLGTRVVVLDGVSIGIGAVVGAGAVVTTDLPENAVAVGVPAKIVRYRS